MNKSLLPKLCCPIDKHDLNIKIFKQQNDEIIEALMTCPDCGRYYPVIYGIPVMTPDEYREKSLEEPILKRWGLQLDEKKEKPLLEGE